MSKKRKRRAAIELWRERLERSQGAYAQALVMMDKREALYLGTHEILGRERAKSATHVRNVVAELIEAQVNSTIPQPKVTPRREKDAHLAKLIEDMLRCELDRLDFETLNDQQERTTPIQGGSMFFLEWNNAAKSTRRQVGELAVSLVHPKQFIPQDGVYSGIENMDYCILAVAQTKEYIKRRYGVDVDDETESEPELRGSMEKDAAEDMVTMYVGFARNHDGGIDRYIWVNDVEIELLENYQMRRGSTCAKCGAPGSETCDYCGSQAFDDACETFEELLEDIVRTDGSKIPCVTRTLDETGKPVEQKTRIPCYRPDVFPLVLRKNVSVFGQFLGDSDVDKITDQQNTIKKLSTKIGEKLLKGGSYITFPNGVSIDKSDEELKIIRIDHPAQKQSIDVLNIQPNISGDLAYQQHVYEEARQIVGVTDSFQGRRDATATSGRAKEFAAAQTAGRLESKHIMKRAAYARLFELMFKFKLAYADEPRPVLSKNAVGHTSYTLFDRYDFLEQDEAGDWYWNDEFLFSCDSTAPLAGNREAMWQETRMNLEHGAFGDPTQLKTLILFWSKMEALHYPGASDTKNYLERELKEQAESISQGPGTPAGRGPGSAQAELGSAASPGVPGEGSSLGGELSGLLPKELITALAAGAGAQTIQPEQEGIGHAMP